MSGPDDGPRTSTLPPFATPDAASFWAGCARGELRLQHCASCGAWQFPPRPFCTACDGRQVEWRRAGGTGTVRSYATVRRPVDAAWAAEAPYVLALVQLQEGPTLMTALQGCSDAQVRIGMPVEVVFEHRPGGFVLPRFRPVADAR